jgi:predicted glycosyltransferase
MLPTILKDRPMLAVSHGSRAQMIACKWLNIPSIAISDYEHAKEIPLFPPTWMIVNEVIPVESCWLKPEKVRKYPGLKEDVYVPDFRPDPSFLQNLGINPQHILVTLRPPATEAHYHNPESEYLFAHLLNRLHSTPNLHVVLLPRNKAQEHMIREQWPQVFASGKMTVPAQAVNGLDLVWHSDLVVSGGGTMNREAAALGVPVYSIFRGKLGAVDEHLRTSGRLIIVQSTAEVDAKIHLQRRERNHSRPTSAPALLGLVEQIEQILRAENHG